MKKPKDANKLEIELYETKFFDYRPVSPEVATMMFMREYVRVMANYKSLTGHENSDGKKGGDGRYTHTLKSFDAMRLEVLRGKPQFKLLAKLRQWADRRGMRYDMFWRFATEAHLKLKFQKTFVNVFFNEAILDKVKAMHADHISHHLVTSDSDFFKASAFEGYPVQKEYYDYVIRGVIKRNDPKVAATVIAKLVHDGRIDQGYIGRALKAGRAV